MESPIAPLRIPSPRIDYLNWRIDCRDFYVPIYPLRSLFVGGISSCKANKLVKKIHLTTVGARFSRKFVHPSFLTRKQRIWSQKLWLVTPNNGPGLQHWHYYTQIKGSYGKSALFPKDKKSYLVIVQDRK